MSLLFICALVEKSGIQMQVKFKLQPHSYNKRLSAIPETLQNGKPLLTVNPYVIDSTVLKRKSGVLTIK